MELRLRCQTAAPPDWVTFEDATAAQVRNHLSRKCSEAVTVSSMVHDMRSEDFDPDREELGAWFDALHRKQAKIKNAVSLREFFEMVEDLLPGEDESSREHTRRSATHQRA